jgi:FixJ family two-component response regulator
MHDLRDCLCVSQPREQEVMTLVVSGRFEQAGRGGCWGISEITVKAHRGKMMQKMKARSLPELVMMAARLCVMPQFDRRRSM